MKKSVSVIDEHILLVGKKVIARQFFHKELRSGRIKKLSCAVCGSKETVAHHTDYDKPLEVIWLCKKHHSEVHRKQFVKFDGPKTEFVHIHLALSGEVAEKLDILAAEAKMKRPALLGRLLDREWKRYQRRAAVTAEAEQVTQEVEA